MPEGNKPEKKGGDIKKLVNDIDRAFTSSEIESIEHIDPLSDMFQKNPDQAIEKLVEYYNTALDHYYTDEKGVNQRAFVQGFAGGPYEGIPWRFYTVVGDHYPRLTKDQKNRVLEKILHGILDKLNYAQVNGLVGTGQTPGIRDPLLLSDIAVVMPSYWPGLDEGRALVKKFEHFTDLKAMFIDKNGLFDRQRIVSDFIVAYSLLRSDFCDFGEYYADCANPKFLNRTMKGIVALRFGLRPDDQETIKKGRERLKLLLPKSLHERIEPLRQEHDWADKALFR